MLEVKRKLAKELGKLPQKCGVYLFKDASNATLYVGKAINLKRRVFSYFQRHDLEGKTALFVPKIAFLRYTETISEFDALLLEAELIKKYRPKFNVIWRDDKHYLYIKISLKEEFPKITLVRKEDDPRAVYFGPFPSGYIAKLVLKRLRHAFPYCSEPRLGSRTCFYNHLGLCNPCPSAIAKLAKAAYQREKRRYRRNIYHLKRILDGKSVTVMNELQRIMDTYSREQKFEQAAKVRDQLRELRYITQQRLSIASYISEPKRSSEEQLKEMESFSKLLASFHQETPFRFPPPALARRIECFDVSNIVGKQATGSLVTFIEGGPDKAYYRRFRIRAAPTPNDVLMIGEVIKRRLNHQEWGKPDVVLVDGGKAQVNAAITALVEKKVSCCVLGLAKSFEELIVPLESNELKYRKLRLKPGSSEFFLLTRIRDEAHRFAVSYHRLLQSKALRMSV